ncbi:MAG: transporter [Cellulomonas sp.]
MSTIESRSSRRDPAKPQRPPARPRIPLNTLAIPFGLLGFAGCWSTARIAFSWDPWVAQVFWIIATVVLAWVVAAHTVRGRHAGSTLRSQLKHPAQGPIAAILPVSVTLIGAHLYTNVPAVAAVLVYVGAGTGLAFAAWLTTLWIRQSIPVQSIHGGYFLPTVAAGYITAGAAAAIGNTTLAVAAFGMGTFFWIVIFTIVLARLALVAPLPGPLTPTLAILVAPPAVGGMAWLAMNGRHLDRVSIVLLGSTVFMMLIQIALFPTYRRLRFTLGFWSFTFSTAAVASQIIAISDIVGYPGWQAVVIAVLSATSGLIVVISVKSLTATRRSKNGTRDEERRLAAADHQVEQ